MFYGTTDTLLAAIGIRPRGGRLRRGEFWAVRDVSFYLKRGEILGIIGMNGSGKSTLLRLINGILPIDTGEISVAGKLHGMIALGAGFHPHYSGLENIFLNGSILGMSRQEIDQALDEIIDFAGIGDFIHAPVSTYSSGMKVRLGFAIAIQQVPDILVVDEILAVGDAGFRAKCLVKFNEVRRKASGVVFVSHDMDQIRSICDRVLVLDQGSILYSGVPEGGIAIYESAREREMGGQSENAETQIFTNETMLSLRDWHLENSAGQRVRFLKPGEGFRFILDFEIRQRTFKPRLGLGFIDLLEKGVNAWYVTYLLGDELGSGSYRIAVSVFDLNLRQGRYKMNFNLKNSFSNENYIRYSRISGFDFEIVEGETSIRPAGIPMLKVQSNWKIFELPDHA